MTGRSIELAACLLIGAAAPCAGAAIINVPADQPGIQAAINVAISGVDEIVVATGTYVENIDLLGKAITLRSTNPSDPAIVAATIIDGGGAGPVVTCNSGEGPTTIISGFVITNGSATAGGGMLNDNASSPTILHCAFGGNEATSGRGGGMFNNAGSSPTVRACTFTANTAATDGGGMANIDSNPTIIDCSFVGNLAAGGDGGAVYGSNSQAAFTGCTMSGNRAGGQGGGLANINDSDGSFDTCEIEGNWADGGAGGVLDDFTSVPLVSDSAICANHPDQLVGGIAESGVNVINAWCPPHPAPPGPCPGDVVANGAVDVLDLLAVLSAWGACP